MRNLYGWSLVAVLCVAGIASAQVRVEPRPAAPGRAPAGQGQAAGMQGTSDQQIAAFIHACARNEVEISRFAQDRAKSDDVKEFAAQMIKEHTQQAEKMARFAGNLVAASGGRQPALARREGTREEGRRIEARRVDPDARERATETRRDEDARREDLRGAAREERAGAERAVAGAQQPLNWTMVHKEIADKCLQNAKKELGRYEGDDFDKAFMGLQLAAHMRLQDELEVLQKHASGQLRQQIEQDLETVKHHLEEARDIMDKQKDQGSEGTSGRSSRSDSRRERER